VRHRANVRLGPKADIRAAKNHVRFTPESGHPSTHQHRAVEQSVAVYLLTHIMIGEEV
jgi:hypothetical protein